MPGNIGNFFSLLWDWLGNIWNSIKDIPQIIINGIGNILKFLFVPEQNYFENEVEKIKYNLSQKIPYQDYINLFGTLETISAGEELSVDLPEYKISNDLTIKQEKFIDFNIIKEFKTTWYGWVRGFTFIFIIIYNINQIMKFLRGFSVSDAATLVGTEKPNSWTIQGQESLFKGGKK